MARTRSAKAASKGTPDEVESTTTTNAISDANKLPPPSTTPPKIFILPKKASPSSRVISLSHPRYGKPTRYLMCPETGLYEFTRITSPKSNPRSWLIEPEPHNGTVSISKNADLHVATRIDPLFLLLPALYDTKSGQDSKRMFLSLDHHLDILADTSSAHMSNVLTSDNIRSLLEGAMRRVCDSAEVGDESMFRLNETKLLECLLEKACRLADPTLPHSMEDKFVTSVLAAPVSNTPSSCPVTTNHTDEIKKDKANGAKSEGTQTLSSTSQPTSEIVTLQRRRVAFNFICSSYLEPELTKHLTKLLAKSSPINFDPLDEYLKQLTKLKQEALAARSIIDYTRKRGLEDDDEADERAEKKRKKEEEEKRKKASESRGVRELKKVNVTGMRKLSDFFKKK